MKKIVAMAAVMLLGTSGAWALGTQSGTDVTNDASLSYTVGTVNYSTDTATEGTTDTFKVDKKVDMVLVTNDGTQQGVVPGATEQKTNFKFTNEGNAATQHFKFEVGNLAVGTDADYDGEGDDQEDVTSIDKVSWTVGANCGAFADGEKTSFPFVLEVPENCDLTMVLESTIPSPMANGKRMHVELKATAVTDNTGNTTEKTQADTDLANADRKTIVDVVLADGASANDAGNTLGEKDNSSGANDNNPDADHDGVEIARSGYVIDMPVLHVSKNSCVFSDPILGQDAKAKRIPGAIILYIVDIENAGTENATGVTFKDTLVAELKGPQTDLKEDDGEDSCSCSNGSEYTSGGGGSAVTNPADADADDQKIEVQNLTITQGKHNCISFKVEIK